jgi:hypothetical protein
MVVSRRDQPTAATFRFQRKDAKTQRGRGWSNTLPSLDAPRSEAAIMIDPQEHSKNACLGKGRASLRLCVFALKMIGLRPWGFSQGCAGANREEQRRSRCGLRATVAWQSLREDGERLWLGEEKLCRTRQVLLLNVG